MKKDSLIRQESKLILNSDNACIVSITKQGNELAKLIKNKVTTRKGSLKSYTLEKFKTKNFHLIKNLDLFFREAFDKFDTIIAIMATGIVIRKVASLLNSKLEDPGIIVLGVNGKNVISLISGHHGHANENTIILAEAINSNPVITTASDNLDLMSVDMIAEDLNTKIVDYSAAKRVTSKIIEGKSITIFSDYKLPESYNSYIIKDINSISSNENGNIIISERSDLNYSNWDTVQLYPKNITIGIGTKKNIDSDLVISKIEKLLKLNNISSYSIKSLATIEEKKEERKIIKWVQNK